MFYGPLIGSEFHNTFAFPVRSTPRGLSLRGRRRFHRSAGIGCLQRSGPLSPAKGRTFNFARDFIALVNGSETPVGCVNQRDHDTASEPRLETEKLCALVPQRQTERRNFLASILPPAGNSSNFRPVSANSRPCSAHTLGERITVRIVLAVHDPILRRYAPLCQVDHIEDRASAAECRWTPRD